MKLQAFTLQVFLKRDSNLSAFLFEKLCKACETFRIPILRNICKELLLEVAYKKTRPSKI